MKKILQMIAEVQIVIVLLMSIACKEVVDTHSPRVTPEILSIGPDTVAIKWNNVGNEYYYSVRISQDSIQDNSFLNAMTVCDTLRYFGLSNAGTMLDLSQILHYIRIG